jgi:hypothetical protein
MLEWVVVIIDDEYNDDEYNDVMIVMMQPAIKVIACRHEFSHDTTDSFNICWMVRSSQYKYW